MTRSLLSRDFERNLFTTRTELKGEFDTGPVSHEALFGFEYWRGTNRTDNRNTVGGLFDQLALAVDAQINYGLTSPIM